MSEFMRFTILNPDLRIMIWEEVLREESSKRRVLLHTTQAQSIHVVPSPYLASPLLRICCESRILALEKYPVALPVYSLASRRIGRFLPGGLCWHPPRPSPPCTHSDWSEYNFCISCAGESHRIYRERILARLAQGRVQCGLVYISPADDAFVVGIGVAPSLVVNHEYFTIPSAPSFPILWNVVGPSVVNTRMAIFYASTPLSELVRRAITRVQWVDEVNNFTPHPTYDYDGRRAARRWNIDAFPGLTEYTYQYSTYLLNPGRPNDYLADIMDRQGFQTPPCLVSPMAGPWVWAWRIRTDGLRRR
ncbi:Uu.00g022600.m01.CDS01 [Anthostomella pinea]|uniref:Uu.00g022600.m01.CDS01 n=1 Tax=Anthostomella pinea TaxID=933095 RepID=A0AAI8VU14_9PEZI|nr:Uu.00g022600.m01.CDS01 [Anthostomella pinea]